MALRPQGRPALSEYDVRYLSINFDGVIVSDWASVSFDSEKNHSYEESPDGTFNKVHGSPETTFDLAVHITSDLVPAMIASYENEGGWFTASIREAPSAGYNGVRFIGSTTDSISQDDAEMDNRHQMSCSITAADLETL